MEASVVNGLNLLEWNYNIFGVSHLGSRTDD